MIVLKKIEFLQPLFLHANMLMRFSEEPKREQLSVSAQKAVWASSIIQTISKASPSLPSTIRDPTLRDEILNLPKPSQEFNFDKDAKNEVMELFTKGITLLKPFRLQSRINKAYHESDPPIIQSESSSSSTQSHKSQPSPERFIFFPIRTVATPMFNLLNDQNQKPDAKTQNLLITGGYGISKTVSIILYIHLSYHQTRFIYEASKDEKKKEEYNKLLKLQLIPENVVKYWFWEMYTNLNENIKQLILKQAVELEPAVRAELKEQPQLIDFFEKLRSHYQIPGLSTRLIIDQVSRIAEFMRESNQNLKEHKHPNDPTSSALLLYKSLQNFLKLGTCYTLNSSMAIQRKLLEKGEKGRLGMDLVDSQRDISMMHIPYEENVSTKAGQLECWQAFWFEIERQAKLPSDQLEAAKQTFFHSIQSRKLSNIEKLKKSTLPAFSSFVYIRQFLYKKNEKLLQSIQSKEYQKIQETIKDFHTSCFRESKQIIKTFLEKGEQRYKRQILLKLYLKARSLKENDKYRFQGLILTIPQLDQILYDENPSFSFKKEQPLSVDARIDLKPLLAFQTESAVKFIFTVEQFTLLIEEVLFSDSFDYANFLQSQLEKDQGSASGVKLTDQGLTPEKYLIDCLIEEGVLVFRVKRSSSCQMFRISQVVPFNELSNISQAKEGESAFELHFQSAIEVALKNPEKDILAIPYVMDDGLRIGYASSNSTVNFAILSYDKYLNRFEFNSFDVTVSRDLTQKMLQARNWFTKHLEGVKSIKGIPLSLTHTYLCPENTSYQQQVIHNAPPLTVPLTILQADLEHIMVATSNFRKHEMFKYIIKLITLEKEKEQYGALYLKHDR